MNEDTIVHIDSYLSIHDHVRWVECSTRINLAFKSGDVPQPAAWYWKMIYLKLFPLQEPKLHPIVYTRDIILRCWRRRCFYCHQRTMTISNQLFMAIPTMFAGSRFSPTTSICDVCDLSLYKRIQQNRKQMANCHFINQMGITVPNGDFEFDELHIISNALSLYGAIPVPRSHKRRREMAFLHLMANYIRSDYAAWSADCVVYSQRKFVIRYADDHNIQDVLVISHHHKILGKLLIQQFSRKRELQLLIYLFHHKEFLHKDYRECHKKCHKECHKEFHKEFHKECHKECHKESHKERLTVHEEEYVENCRLPSWAIKCTDPDSPIIVFLHGLSEDMDSCREYLLRVQFLEISDAILNEGRLLSQNNNPDTILPIPNIIKHNVGMGCDLVLDDIIRHSRMKYIEDTLLETNIVHWSCIVPYQLTQPGTIMPDILALFSGL